MQLLHDPTEDVDLSPPPPTRTRSAWRSIGSTAPRWISPDDVERYGVTAAQLAALQSRYDRLATDLRAQVARGSSGAGLSG